MSSSPGPRITRALQHRNFRLFFGGQSISLVGTWITRVATSWLVYRLTGSELLLGVAGFCGQIPTLFITPFAGVLVDRMDRRKILLLTQAEGMSVVHETVFEDRFGYVAALHKMGADMALYDACLGGALCRFHSSNYKHSCVIKGPMHLRGAHITVPDLRAGFTYLIAAVLAQGQSTIEGLSHIERGYENLEDSLRRLGVRIAKVPG